MTEELEAVSYCIGMSVGDSLLQQNLKELSTEILAEAINDSFEGNQMKYTPEEANTILQKYITEQGQKKYGANREAGEKF
jgi:FKBP-type peptidyl-prolyl cis-trans isomerase FklB